jgi:hypothetical protein
VSGTRFIPHFCRGSLLVGGLDLEECAKRGVVVVGAVLHFCYSFSIGSRVKRITKKASKEGMMHLIERYAVVEGSHEQEGELVILDSSA